MRLLLVLSLSVFSSMALAKPVSTVDRNVNCDDLGNILIGNANMATINQYDQILQFKNGKPVVTKTDRVTSHEVDGNQTTIAFNRQVPVNYSPVEAQEKVKIRTNQDGYTIDYILDSKIAPPGTVGNRTHIQRGVGGPDCMINQASTLARDPSGNTFEVVNLDRKFCDSVAGLMEKFGKAQISQCSDLLQKISAAYNTRVNELQKSQKLFFEGQAFNSYALAMTSMNNCGPDAWYESVITPMGPQRVLKAESASVPRNSTQGRGRSADPSSLPPGNGQGTIKIDQ